MTSVLKPEITSIINGLLTIAVRSTTQVAAVFNQLQIYRADSINGPFSLLDTATLTGAGSYQILDTDTGPGKYYKAQFFNSSTLAMSVFSEPAQETGVFSEYTVPVSTATYPPELALSEQDREIIESIRITIGDIGDIQRDFYDSSDSNSQHNCASQISSDKKTWELFEFKGWPQQVIINGVEKTDITDPLVKGYKFLTFTGSEACITGTLDVFYNHFRFSDREILLAYDRSSNLLVDCGLTVGQVTTEMRIMQAAILLLEGELRQSQGDAVSVRDGDTSYNNTAGITSRTGDLEDLKRKMREIIECARINASYGLTGVRID
jgi:hypothetical protein